MLYTRHVLDSFYDDDGMKFVVLRKLKIKWARLIPEFRLVRRSLRQQIKYFVI